MPRAHERNARQFGSAHNRQGFSHLSASWPANDQMLVTGIAAQGMTHTKQALGETRSNGNKSAGTKAHDSKARKKMSQALARISWAPCGGHYVDGTTFAHSRAWTCASDAIRSKSDTSCIKSLLEPSECRHVVFARRIKRGRDLCPPTIVILLRAAVRAPGLPVSSS